MGTITPFVKDLVEKARATVLSFKVGGSRTELNTWVLIPYLLFQAYQNFVRVFEVY